MQDLNEKTKEPLGMLKSDENILIQELYEHGGHKAKQKGNYSCIYCSSSDAMSLYINKKGEHNYKCFSCGETGDVIALVPYGRLIVSVFFVKNAFRLACSFFNVPSSSPSSQIQRLVASILLSLSLTFNWTPSS